MSEQDVIRVMIVDDHAMVRMGLAAILKTGTGIELVGESASGEEAISRCAQDYTAV